MRTPSDASAGAFRELERCLARRRWAQLDLRLRVELAALAILLVGFLFWQVRVPLDGLRNRVGPVAVLQAIAVAWVAISGLGGALAGFRHARRLRSGPAGPEWLALPVRSASLSRHLASDSRSLSWWAMLPASGVLAAAFGLVPTWWLPILAGAFTWLLLGAGRLGTVVGQWAVVRRAPPGDDPMVRLLGGAQAAQRRGQLSAARWRRSAPWLVLWLKDLALTLRRPAVARSALTAVVLWTMSVLVWSLPGEASFRHFAAFVAALLGAAALAEWLVALSGSDPFATLRALPVSLSTVWFARFAWAMLGTAALLTAHALGARDLSPHALRLFLAWTGAATLGIAALGVNYGVTLFPRAAVAQRLLGLSLGLAVAASIMIPLSGWIVLLCAILHSARRLRHWDRLEEL